MKINITILLFLITLSLFPWYFCAIKTTEFIVTSPDEKLTAFFGLDTDRCPYYRLEFSGNSVLQPSRLGLIREDGDFSQNLTLTSVPEVTAITDEYEVLQRRYTYSGNQRIFHLQNPDGQKIDVIFRVSNDGLAFRYYFPERSNKDKKIIKEFSSFHFLPGTTAWIQPMTAAKSGWGQAQPSYEELYRQDVAVETLNKNDPGWVIPALVHSRQTWLLVTETAADSNYCGCRLQHDSTSTQFVIGFPQAAEIFPGGGLLPQSTLPWYTPWRLIVVGDSLKTIVESTLGTDLARPAAPQDVSYIQPGKAAWSWVLLKDNATVFAVQKRFIDFAADMQWQYCLIDADWDTQIGYEKIQELVDYARRRQVGILLWYNSAGDWNTTPYHPKSMLLTHTDRLREFGRLQKMGVKGIKVDFFGGDGRSMMTYYQDIFTDAAQFGLVVNCHGATSPRGWQRTYPNLLTMEAVRGFEFVTFEQLNADLEANHCCVLPFTRNVFDPMDFTPVCFSEVPNIQRTTTNGFELALSVIFWSGIQHYAETPDGMAAVAPYVKDFLRQLPTQWQETRFIDGFPGKLVVLARRAQNAWYVAGINGETLTKPLELKLPFLGTRKTGRLITDGADRRSFDLQTVEFIPGKSLPLTLKGNGGFVAVFAD